MIKTLEDAGFEIARSTAKSISIKDPDGGRNIRLKGKIYEQDFRFGKELRGEIERAREGYRADRATEFKKHEKRLIALLREAFKNAFREYQLNRQDPKRELEQINKACEQLERTVTGLQDTKRSLDQAITWIRNARQQVKEINEPRQSYSLGFSM